MSSTDHVTLRFKPHVVYVAKDRWGITLYVGCTHDLAKRLRGHRAKHAPWLRHTEAITAHPHTNWWAARLDEAEKIRRLHPVYNEVRMLHEQELLDSWQWMADHFDPDDLSGTIHRHDAWAQERVRRNEAHWDAVRTNQQLGMGWDEACLAALSKLEAETAS